MDLRQISMFKDLTSQDIKLIEERNLIEEKTYQKEDHIFRVGDVTGDAYYLIEGSILVYKIDPNGKRFIIKKIQKPGVFGEVYSYLKEGFDFSAQAEVASKILIIHDFASIFAYGSKGFLKSYIDMLSRKCLELSRTNQITSQASLRQKISKYLLLNQENSMVKVNLSREEWADILATTRPSLSRELSNMVDDGLIEIENKTIKITNLSQMADII